MVRPIYLVAFIFFSFFPIFSGFLDPPLSDDGIELLFANVAGFFAKGIEFNLLPDQLTHFHGHFGMEMCLLFHLVFTGIQGYYFLMP